MGLLQAFRNLPPRTRLGVGLAIMAWSTAGLYISDASEKRLGLEASQKDRDALKEAVLPRITVVEREKGN